jgi:carboxyl-terminal processing protease
MSFEDWILDNKEEYVRKISEVIETKYVFWNQVSRFWQGKVEQYVHLVKECDNLKDIYSNIDKMLLELNDPHTRFRNHAAKGEAKVLLTKYKGKYYIIDVLYNNSSLNKGAELIKINGVDIKKIEKEIGERYKFESKNIKDICVLEELSTQYLKQDCRIECIDDGNCVSERISNDNRFDLREVCSGNLSSKLKSIYERRIDNETEYINLPTFNHPMIDKDFEEFLKVSKGKNLIIDVRSNMGGLIEKAVNVTSLLLKDSKTIGYMVSRNDDTLKPITINPTEKYIEKFEKIIILADRNTGSSAENIFIRALKNSSDKIRIIGTDTMGLVHQATVFTLKDNSQLQVTTSKYYDKNRNLLKAVGIEPDIFVENGLDIFKGKDTQLSMAIKIINI